MPAESKYQVLHQIPDAQTYCHLRTASGLSAKTTDAAERGLKNSLFAVQIADGDQIIGMGRVIGDGGTTYQVCDIAVLPDYQGQGLGKRIMLEIKAYLDEHAPESAYVSLIADGPAQHLYAQYGFSPVTPASIGMAYKVGRKS
ncbi:GNAT family N-acetyltransferase [Pseudochrobactrum sp. B5]|uniref:GNAT family N-acetyltransferase n=1 Tax=Pseudochrobactrum sp. B5 TaxID=1289478 RepID=UPI000952E39C|nr:GNAT family N-acetyltransferase [Pseudochrobactrum sp. B5]